VCEESARLFADRKYGLWLARDESRTLVGFGGFWHFPDRDGPELVYGVAADRWRQGFGTEIARALVDYGFTTLGWPEILASVDAPNTTSVRMLERLGRYVRGTDILFFRITP
jgi:RimJ/RimL family protein N-acetyltransferase